MAWLYRQLEWWWGWIFKGFTRGMAWGIPIFLETSTSPGIVFIWGKLRFSGWWLSHPSEKILVNWDRYSQYMEKKMFQTTNQKIIEACVSRHVVQVSALGSCLLCSSVLFQHVRHVTKNLWWSSIPASARENCLSVASNASLFPRITATQV